MVRVSLIIEWVISKSVHDFQESVLPADGKCLSPYS
jgi:hypothetical protein